MIYLFLAPGFEEVEALFPLDLLRRASLDVRTVGIGGRTVTGSHGITVTADLTESFFLEHFMRQPSIEAVILPGGMPGTSNLDASPSVELALELAAAKGAYLCAICAAPLVLGKRGYLEGKRATCFPGFEAYLTGATVGGKVIRDGKVITAAGMGVAMEFGLELISVLAGPETAGRIKESIRA